MKSLPFRFLLPAYSRQSFAIVRSLLESDLTVEEIAGELTKIYKSSCAEVQYHIGRLLAFLYDFEAQHIALECAKMFELPTFPDLTVSESIYITGYDAHDALYWRNNYTEKVTCWDPILTPFPEENFPMVVDPSGVGNVLTINPLDGLYVLRDKDNGIHLFTVDEGEEDILIDEQVYADTPAYYFTATKHFVSPVFRLKRAKQILEYCLSMIGYPYIPIRMTVVFTERKTLLINVEDYIPGGECADAWKGVNVILQAQLLPEAVFPEAKNFMGSAIDPESIHGDLYAGMLNSIAATSILYRALRKDDDCYPPLTSKLLRSECLKNDIFKKLNDSLNI